MPASNSDLLTVKKCFWPWQDEMEEAWLSNMALNGWHLSRMNWSTFGNKYTFTKGASKKVRYCMDYPVSTKDRENYTRIFEDAGWEHVGKLSGWYYFRKEYLSDELPEIYTDTDSKIQRYKRMLSVYAALMVSLGIFPVTLSLSFGSLSFGPPDFFRGLLMGIGVWFELIFIFLLSKIMGRITQLKKQQL